MLKPDNKSWYVHVSELNDEIPLRQSLVVFREHRQKFCLELWLKNTDVIIGDVHHKYVVLLRATTDI